MKTGFIILNYNSERMTSMLACEVSKYRYIDLVVIVDNASDDTSLELLKELDSDKILLIENKTNGGYSQGNNVGLRYLAEKGYNYAIVANPDVYIDELNINRVIEELETNEYMVLSPVEYDANWMMVDPPTTHRMEYWDDFYDCFIIGRRLKRNKLKVELDRGVSVQNTQMLRGSFLAFNLSKFASVGFFDERVFLYCEERILSKKAEDFGFKMGLITDAKYQHNHMASIVNTYKSVSSKISILYKSRYYYNTQYLHIGALKRAILKIAMANSILEYQILDICNYIKLRGDN